MSDLPRRSFPCSECPWKRGTRPGQFTAARYAQIRASAGTPTAADLSAGMFGCHKGEPGTDADLACAGWLAVEGHKHLLVRIAVLTSRLEPGDLAPDSGWPALWDSYDQMAENMGRPR